MRAARKALTPQQHCLLAALADASSINLLYFLMAPPLLSIKFLQVSYRLAESKKRV